MLQRALCFITRGSELRCYPYIINVIQSFYEELLHKRGVRSFTGGLFVEVINSGRNLVYGANIGLCENVQDKI